METEIRDTARMAEELKTIGMRLMLMSDEGKLQTLFLPCPPKDRYDFGEGSPVTFAPENGRWAAEAAGGFRIFDSAPDGRVSAVLSDHSLLILSGEQRQYQLYAEETNRADYTFHHYAVQDGAEIWIGRSSDNDLVCRDETVSRYHAVLQFENRSWSVRDCRSRNGVFVNGRKVRSAALSAGDVICIMGMRLIIGSGFLSVNDGNSCITVRPGKLSRMEKASDLFSSMQAERQGKPEEPFARSPRRRMTFDEKKKIEFSLPPLSMQNGGVPAMLSMGSSVLMSGQSIMSGNLIMPLAYVLFPLLSRGYTKEQREEYEHLREQKYVEYLQGKKNEILSEKALEEKVLNTNYPPLREVTGYAYRREKLWERRKTDDDFLRIRVGSGELPLKAKLEYPKKQFQMDEDKLRDSMYQLAEQKIMLKHVPVQVDLIRDHLCAVLGGREVTRQFARDMIVRMALLYSYDEVKFIILAEEEDLSGMEFVRYIPHTWNNDHTLRYIASNMAQACQIGEALSKDLEKDLDKPRELQEILKEHPYYMVFAFSRHLYESVEVLKSCVSSEKTPGVSVMTFFEDAPMECSLLLQMSDQLQDPRSTIIHLQNPDMADQEFLTDQASEDEEAAGMRRIARIRLKTGKGAYTLPKMMTFLEMYGVGRIEQLNIRRRWHENDPVNSLAVPVGVGTDGEPFILDLHQKYQGPHGLVAGTTGSGKSEFLLTYILSLAVNFHPDEVAFVLIDYKGGGLAGAFDDRKAGVHLPHVLATITNLDGSEISRSLLSIQSEMLRRQRIFNDARSETGEGTMDIYTYQRLHRAGKVKEPMPHLFIISDEFAELKQQQPEFLSELVSIARIGRSLGVHLILATQKPMGVVTDQILSNTRFRICLKVQDKGDSMEMLRRPEAADLRNAGRFYLQVGNNELFALGQSAWSGASYEPSDTVLIRRDESVEVIDSLGNTILEEKPEKKVSPADSRSQLVEIVRAIQAVAEEEKIPGRYLWLPPLPARIDLKEIRTEEAKQKPVSLKFPAGMADDPEYQKQVPFSLDLETCGHIFLAGEQASGKTTFVRNLLAQLTERCSADEAQYYILDYSSRLLNNFRSLPHCGGVLEEDDENLLDGFFKLIDSITEERRSLFARLEVSSFADARRLTSLPFILIVIDNAAVLTQTRTGYSCYEMLHQRMKKSAGLGVSYLITVNHVNEITPRIREECTTRIALQLKDAYEFSECLGTRVKNVPPAKSGRGIYVIGGRPLEIQLAMMDPELSARDQIDALKDRLLAAADREKIAGTRGARRLNIVSNEQTYEEFSAQFRPGRLPLGYDVKNAEPVALPYRQYSKMALYFGNPASVKPVLQNLIHISKEEKGVVIFSKAEHDSAADSLDLPESARIYGMNGDGPENLVRILAANCSAKYNQWSRYCSENGKNPESYGKSREGYEYILKNFTPLTVIFERYSELVRLSQEIGTYKSSFSSDFLLAPCCNIRFYACFYADDSADIWGYDLTRALFREASAVLVGGMYLNMGMYRIPSGQNGMTNVLGRSEALMQYQGVFHELFLPMGPEEKDEEQDEDAQPIFRGK